MYYTLIFAMVGLLFDSVNSKTEPSTAPTTEPQKKTKKGEGSDAA